MKTRILVTTVAAVGALTAGTLRADEVAPVQEDRPLIQIALLLDTSDSMSGMINQARNQLWSIVNRFVDARRDGVRPRLEVALYHYGTPALGPENGFVKQLCPLTEDLDVVSERLFELTTRGGAEYCGWGIRTAVNELQWSGAPNDYKAIFIAGNESFAQGKVDYRTSCKSAIAKGIVVNTIHCSGGSDDQWKDGALLADGRFMHIDQNKAVVEIQTPYDEELAKLGAKINTTYVAYGGREAQEARRRQERVDRAALSFGASNMAKRAAAKSSTFYKNEKWDLVDAADQEGFRLEEVGKDQLPEEMQEMSADERKAYVDQKRAEREALQQKIQELTRQREDFLAEKRQELAEENEATLGSQVQDAVVDQASEAGFNF